MTTLIRWFDVPGLSAAPFLAINLSNAKPETRSKNTHLFEGGKTGDWLLNKALHGKFLVDHPVVLYFRVDRAHALIYTGRCLQVRKNGIAKDGRPRFRLTMANGWHVEGQTTVPFTRFFEGFTMSSNPTVVWATPERYSEPEDDLPEIDDVNTDPADPDDDPDDDAYVGVLGAETMAEVALRAHQRIFVRRLTRVWGKRCALTGLSAPRLLHSCHIVPYKGATPEEKVSAHNGLLLCAHLHMLMDAHLLGFDDEGALLLARSLDGNVRALVLAPGATRLRRVPSAEQVAYLQRHRHCALSIGNVLTRVSCA
jgi:hypothetical protein